MKIALGCDHGGFELKQEVVNYFRQQEIDFLDFGCYDTKSCDYPEYASLVTDSVLKKETQLGILICGTGIGMSIAANKKKGIRAAVCGDCFSAEATREHNDANILCLGARVTGPGLGLKIVETFINTDFSNDKRHIRRIGLIE